MFVSLLSYHYGKGTIDAEDFSERMDEVFAAKSLAELYRLTADLPFPPPLLGPGGQGPSRRRRWWSK